MSSQLRRGFVIKHDFSIYKRDNRNIRNNIHTREMRDNRDRKKIQIHKGQHRHKRQEIQQKQQLRHNMDTIDAIQGVPKLGTKENNIYIFFNGLSNVRFY